MNPASTDLEITIRKMALADIDRVIEIDQSSFSLPWPKSSFHFELTENNSSRPWVAETSDQKIVGMAVNWLIVDELHIATIAADPDYRQHHIGLRLMVHSLCCAAEEGAVCSFLEVRRGNLAARSLYQKLGYTEDGIRPRYYEDNHEDAILMSLQKINLDFLKSLV